MIPKRGQKGHLGDMPIITAPVWYKGHRVELSTTRFDLIGKRWRRYHSFYEHFLLDYLAKRAISGVYLDLGANVGNHAVFFGLFCLATRVIAVEGHQATYKLLLKNLDNLDGKCPYIAYNRLVSDESGIRMREPRVRSRNTMAGGWTYEPADDEEPAVLTTTIDDLCLIDPPAVLKIDVDGHEIPVLTGGLKTIESHRPLICIECMTDETLGAVGEILSPLGYAVTWSRTKGKGCPMYVWEAA